MNRERGALSARDAAAAGSSGLRGVPLRALAVDAIAVLVIAVVMVWEYSTPLDDGSRPADPVLALSVPASVLAFAPLLVRRFFPFSALVVSACSLALPGLIAPVWTLFFSGFVPAVFLLYTVARYRGLTVALGGAALLTAMEVASTWSGRPQAVVANTVFLLTFAVIVIALGVALRRSAAQRTRLAGLLARLEAEQVDRERLALLDERAALARDLHDVVAHSVSLMLVQAGAARLAIEDDRVLVRQLLAGVEVAGASAMTDLRQLLQVLRSDADITSAAPPGLSALPALIARMREAGMELELVITGTPHVLPAGLDVAVYRLVQEALTNVVKHAGPTRACVEIACDDPVRITVRDDGPKTPVAEPGPPGHGLIGMQERAALFGGRVEAGPSGRGFQVIAMLPLPEPA